MKASNFAELFQRFLDWPIRQGGPLGGTALRHFAHALVRVEARPKVTEYVLEQHPSRRCQRLLDFERARGVKPQPRTATLDFFLKRGNRTE